jgi:iron complex outermembrane receptor protein
VNERGSKGELRRDETGTVDSDDIYALANWRVSPKLTWLTGIRRSDIRFAVDDRYIVPGVVPDDSGAASYVEASWSTGLNYQLNDSWAVFGSLGEGFETPTLTELAYRNEGTGLNRALTPAAIEQFEAGLKWAAVNNQAQLSLFEVRSDDEIVVDRSIDGRTTYRNAAKTRRQGVELSHQWFINRYWQLRSSATWLTARYEGTDLDGKRIPGVANGNLFSQLNWRPWQDDRLRASVAAQYRSRIAVNDANDEYAPSYLIWNASVNARQQQGKWSFSQWVRLDNLLDRDYVGAVVVNQGSGRSFEPAPGRQLSAGVTIERRF